MIYTVADMPLKTIHDLPDAPKPKGNPGTKKKRPRYKAVVCAFDIETTAIRKIRQSIMYIWQMQIGFDITIIGRTWDEFLEMIGKLSLALGDIKLVTYVHNLSYEFQFLSGIWHFDSEDVFCTEPRSILHATLANLELRCSYRLTNMSLDQFTRSMKVQHRKLSGKKFDYNKIRYPWTKLSDYELDYATYDVIGLVEAVNQLMINEGDTLYSIPMTATGYVRRDVKKAMKTYNWDSMHRQLADFPLQLKLRRAFRGGNTHADRHFVGHILHDVYSWDMASAYPAVMINKEFPTGRWFDVEGKNCTLEYLNDLINRRHKAVLMEVSFLNIRLKDPRWPVPYIPYDKCDHLVTWDTEDFSRHGNLRRFRMSLDNGRVMAAQYLEMTITDIDMRIIADEYEWDNMDIRYMAFSTYGKLPNQFREVILKYYKAKTELKNVRGREYEYDSSKRKINSIYGCTVQDPIQIRYLFEDQEEIPYVPDTSRTAEEIYAQQTNYAYQSYAWGVWTTCYCRLMLEEGISLVYQQGQKEKLETGSVKTHFLYCDTDSIKFIGQVDMSILNDTRIKLSSANNAYATDPKGKIHYLGVYEYEGCYPEFITWGAKKYVYRDQMSDQLQTVAGTGDTWHITIAGVGKKEGARELERAGGIHQLLPDDTGRPHFVFRDAGGVEAIYNDAPGETQYKVGDKTIPITRNIYLQKHTYTLSVTEEYEKILLYPDMWRDLIDSHAAI